MTNDAPRTPADLRDVLAAERTALAWIRTGLALMGFGFVVARFGLFLQELHALRPEAHTEPRGLSLWFGTALILAGVAVAVFSGYSHAALVRTLDPSRSLRPVASRLALVTSIFLGCVGIAMAVYLVASR